MNDADRKTKKDSPAESLTGSTDDLEDTGTTMRLQTLKLEGELWPEGEPAAQEEEEDDGVDPYNTGRFDTSS
ncbi:MAG: hypothetical protein ACR2QR_12640 [Woeseiaceae bacterium]